MLPIYLFVAATSLAAAPVAFAQEQQETQNAQPVEQSAPEPARMAVPRPAAPATAAPRERTPSAPAAAVPRERTRSAPAPQSPAPFIPAPVPQITPAPTQQAAPAADDQRRAVPRTRDRGDNPPIGQAVPRGEVRRAPAPPPSSGGRPGRTIYAGPSVYNNYYYYPRRSYPYGYGAFGLGYFYYDPYSWYPGYYGSGYRSYGYSGYSGYSGYYPYPGYPGYRGAYSYFDIGELRLSVRPRDAQVFVDGYYAGEVDDYDGMFQGLKLESGPYHIELVAPGYETLAFDIRINPGQKINYRGDLRPLP
jgi:hypothetical protein